MTTTWSNLKVQLMGTGDNATTWGDITNTNLGTALEEAIVNTGTVTFASNNQTLTLTDSNATQTARKMRLRCTGTTGGSTRDLIVPAIEKPYIIQNDCADSVRVKNSTGTGITVPAGKTMWVYNNGTNVVDVVNYLTSLSIGDITVTGNVAASGNSAVTGNSTVGGTLAVTGNTTVGGTLGVTGNVTASANVAITGNTSTNNLAVTGAVTATNINAGVAIVSGGTVSASTVGYRGLPQSVKTTSYTLALADAGTQVSTNSNVAIPANASVAFPVGTTVVVYNDSASSISITITTDTLRLAGTATTGTRTVAQRGLCTLNKVGTTTWAAVGAGVS